MTMNKLFSLLLVLPELSISSSAELVLPTFPVAP